MQGLLLLYTLLYSELLCLALQKAQTDFSISYKVIHCFLLFLFFIINIIFPYAHISTTLPSDRFYFLPERSCQLTSVACLSVSVAHLGLLYVSSNNLCDWLPVTPCDLQLSVMTTGH